MHAPGENNGHLITLSIPWQHCLVVKTIVKEQRTSVSNESVTMNAFSALILARNSQGQLHGNLAIAHKLLN